MTHTLESMSVFKTPGFWPGLQQLSGAVTTITNLFKIVNDAFQALKDLFTQVKANSEINKLTALKKNLVATEDSATIDNDINVQTRKIADLTGWKNLINDIKQIISGILTAIPIIGSIFTMVVVNNHNAEVKKAEKAKKHAELKQEIESLRKAFLEVKGLLTNSSGSSTSTEIATKAALLGPLDGLLAPLTKAVTDLLTPALAKVEQTLQQILDLVNSLTTQIPSSVAGQVTTALNSELGTLTPILTGLQTEIASLLKAIQELPGQLPTQLPVGDITAQINTALVPANNLIQQVQTLIEKLQTLPLNDALNEQLTALTKQITDAIETLPVKITPEQLTGVKDTLTAKIGDVENLVKADAINKQVANALAPTVDLLKKLLDKLSGGLHVDVVPATK